MYKWSMKRTCLKSVLDMTLWRTKKGEIREGRKEMGGDPMLAWRAAAPRARNNMTLSGFRVVPLKP